MSREGGSIITVPKGGSVSETVHGHAVSGVDNVVVSVELRIHIDDLHLGSVGDPDSTRAYMEQVAEKFGDSITVAIHRAIDTRKEQS